MRKTGWDMTDHDLGVVVIREAGITFQSRHIIDNRPAEYAFIGAAIRALFPRPVVRQDAPSVEEIRRRFLEDEPTKGTSNRPWIASVFAETAHAMMLELQKPEPRQNVPSVDDLMRTFERATDREYPEHGGRHAIAHVCARVAHAMMLELAPRSLTFEALRSANLARLGKFKNSKGETSHTEPDGSDWSLNDWCTAVCGELGELANLLKKIRRGDTTLDEQRVEVGKELADVMIYLDILAFRCGVDLADATIQKFNEVSDRIGVDVRLANTPAPQPDPDAEAKRLCFMLNHVASPGVYANETECWDDQDETARNGYRAVAAAKGKGDE